MDGHKTQGALGFAVGNATSPTVPPQEAPPLDPKALVGKSLAFAGLTLLVGALVFEALILPSRHRANLPLRTMATIGALGQVVGLGLLAWSQVAASGLLPRAYLWDTAFGRGLASRFLLCVAVVGFLRSRPTWLPAIRTAGYALLTAILLVLYGAFSHTAASLPVLGFGTALDALHLAAVTAWVGGLACLVLFLSVRSLSDAGGPELLAHVTGRFHRLALTSVLTLVATGLVMLIVLLGAEPTRWRDHLATPYGILLGGKILIAGAMILLGGGNRFYFVAHFLKLRRFQLRRLFRAFVAGEVFLGAIALLLAAAATNLSPLPPEREGQPPEPLMLDGQSETLRFQLAILPPPTAANESTFRVTLTRSSDGSPVEDAFRVRLSFRYLEADLGGTTVLAEPVGGGVYERTGSFFPASGRWELELSASTPEVFFESVRFELFVP